jgi:hypothetical protein
MSSRCTCSSAADSVRPALLNARLTQPRCAAVWSTQTETAARPAVSMRAVLMQAVLMQAVLMQAVLMRTLALACRAASAGSARPTASVMAATLLSKLSICTCWWVQSRDR